jgi:hypothetical protein
MKDEPTPAGLTILGRCGFTLSLRLVSDRVASWEWESFPRRAESPRYRQRGLPPWPPIDAKPLPRVGGETDGEAAN